jgi:hypothetical protein
VKKAMKKLRCETTLMMALMAMPKKEKRKKRSVALSHGVATTLKKLERLKKTCCVQVWCDHK